MTSISHFNLNSEGRINYEDVSFWFLLWLNWENNQKGCYLPIQVEISSFGLLPTLFGSLLLTVCSLGWIDFVPLSAHFWSVVLLIILSFYPLILRNLVQNFHLSMLILHVSPSFLLVLYRVKHFYLKNKQPKPYFT